MKQKYNQPFHQASAGKFIISLLMLLCYPFCSYGQSGASGNPADIRALFKNQQIGTPAAAALVQNIVYPVNYSTGLAEIKIPLYEVTGGDVSIPIYLTYHASGIKLSDAAGWTGLGWDLVAEPMISRTIRGMADDGQGMKCKFDKYAYGKDKTGIYYIDNLTKNPREEPDEYYYRLPDKQGMFMYAMEPVDVSRAFLPMPYDDIRIDWVNHHFRITDDDGTVYNFNGAKDVGGIGIDVIGWKASSVVAPNRKDSVSFIYNSVANRYFTENYNDYIVVKDAFSWKQYLSTDRMDIPANCDVPSLPDEWMQDPIIVNRMNNVTSTHQATDAGEIVDDGAAPDRSTRDRDIYTDSYPLSEIRFPRGTVTFTEDSKYPRLQKMTVRDFNGNIVREIQFNYLTPSYNVTNRYFLESIVITDRDGKPGEKYVFGYCKPLSLPLPGTRAIDYWGYFNNAFHHANKTMVPQQTIGVTRGYFTPDGYYSSTAMEIKIGSETSREADEDYMQYGTLNSITYPAGSKDEFTYEAHRYRKSETEVKCAGGLRIKEIKTTDKEGTAKVRTFIYGAYEDGCGTPATADPLHYFHLDQNMCLGDPFTAFIGSGSFVYEPDGTRFITARHRTYSCTPMREMTFDGGTSVVYPLVTEYNGTPEKNSGKTTYQYCTQGSLPLTDGTDNMRCDRHEGWAYNQLENKCIYRNDQDTYTLLEMWDYYYPFHIGKYGKIITGEAFAPYIVRESLTARTPDYVVLNNLYRQTEAEVGVKLLERCNHVIYTDGKRITTRTEYEYDDAATTYPTCITETGSDGIPHVTELTYPRDYRQTPLYSDMVKRNIIRPVVKKGYTRKGEYLGIETPYSSPYADVFQPECAVISRAASEEGEVRITYLYDDYGRLRQETKDGKESVVYLYGYDNQHIIACIENATYAEVEAKLGGKAAVNEIASAHVPFMTGIDQLRTSLPLAHVTSYTYTPLVGIASITNPTGLTTYYEYDSLGRLVKTYLLNGNRQEVIGKNEYHYANE